MIIRFLDKQSSKADESYRRSEWGPQAIDAMCDEVRDFGLPRSHDGTGLTLGDYIDRTPKSCIAKVMLEEKVFQSWYGG